MSLRDEIKSYTDSNGYINPYPVAPTAGRSCDNACMFSSEYYIMLEKLKQDNHMDADEWEILIDKSSIMPGLTVRYPGSTDLDAPDNIYGILAASKVLNKPQVAASILAYGVSNFGFFNTSNPGHIKNKDGSWNWPAFQWRQPQQIFAAACASNTYKWWKFWYYPVELVTALIIATSCYNTPNFDTDARRLSWLLVQTVKDSSWLCSLASKIWYKRLYKDYGSAGMAAVAGIYYQPQGPGNNPFSKYWVD